ncbi:MAG TPA: twin transmembrane helix small protein [Stellaceae bacterium]|nr:twin transmembrane helix small protein [Stellaceae bacterium]
MTLGEGRVERYITPMQYVFPILVVLAMLGALGALALGVINMAKGNDPRRSNKLMQSRVLLQALALVLFAIFMLLFRR